MKQSAKCQKCIKKFIKYWCLIWGIIAIITIICGYNNETIKQLIVFPFIIILFIYINPIFWTYKAIKYLKS